MYYYSCTFVYFLFFFLNLKRDSHRNVYHQLYRSCWWSNRLSLSLFHVQRRCTIMGLPSNPLIDFNIPLHKETTRSQFRGLHVSPTSIPLDEILTHTQIYTHILVSLPPSPFFPSSLPSFSAKDHIVSVVHLEDIITRCRPNV